MVQQTIRVILIEDNVTDAARVRQVLRRPTRGTDFQLEQFTNLKSGLAGLKSAHFDVLLLDLGLPDSNGLRTLSKVVAVAPRLPILVLASADIPSGVLETIKNDGRNFLSKSRMSAEDLVAAVLREAMGIKAAFGDGDPDPAVLDSSPGTTSKAVRVLVIEDDHGDLAAIRFLLASVRAAHFHVAHAPNLSSALDLLGNGNRIDVVLLDLTLPDCQGLKTLRQVRGKDPSTPVVILARPEDRLKAVEALSQGAQDYVVKGQVDSYLLGQTILRRVESKDSVQENQTPQTMGRRATQ